MGRKDRLAPTTETKTQRRDRAIVQVRLDEVLPEVRARFEQEWDRREAQARALRDIRGTKGHTDANAVMSEGRAYAGGMVRGKDVEPSLPKKTKKIHPEIVVPDEQDTTASDGTSGTWESDKIAAGPDRESVDVAGVPTVRRRRA